jgi:hypothetical protein
VTALPAIGPLIAQGSTTTTSAAVRRVVGEPLPSWVVLAASAALLVAILAAGFLAERHRRRADPR